MIVRPAQSQNAVLKTHKGKGGHINEICKYEKNDGMFDGCTDGMVCISDQKLYYITGRPVCSGQDPLDILAYELLFLASCFGFVTAMGTGILKKNHSEE